CFWHAAPLVCVAPGGVLGHLLLLVHVPLVLLHLQRIDLLLSLLHRLSLSAARRERPRAAGSDALFGPYGGHTSGRVSAAAALHSGDGWRRRRAAAGVSRASVGASWLGRPRGAHDGRSESGPASIGRRDRACPRWRGEPRSAAGRTAVARLPRRQT